MRKKLHLVALLALYAIVINAQSVEPMLTTQWGQGVPYKNACPNSSVAGCGPVALSQILKYYQQPAHGYGHVKYTSANTVVDKDLENTTFDWQNILDVYQDSNYTDTQAKAVAELLYACGAAVYAKYGITSTSTSYYPRILYGMQHHLHFSQSCRYYDRMYYSTAEWIEMLNEQLRSGHPVFYWGYWTYMVENPKDYSGHMFVIDGINDENKYHVNWGKYNNQHYVDINVLNFNTSFKYPGGRPVCYNANQGMVVDCYPTPDCTNYVKQACILDSPIIINNDKSIESLNINKGDTFNIVCSLKIFSDTTLNVDYRWTLEQNDTLIKEYTKGNVRVYFSTGKSITNAIAVPKELEDGTYTLRLYTKSDIEPEWQAVWANAPTNVSVVVNENEVTVTPPDNHMKNPLLYLAKEPIDTIAERAVVSDSAPGRYICLDVINKTTNNFFDNIKIEFAADGEMYTYEKKLPIYSQSKTEYHVFIPQSTIDLEDKSISIKKVYYFYDGKYIELGLTEPSNIKAIEKIPDKSVAIYNLQGVLVKKIKAEDVSASYANVLYGLQKGIYIVKEGLRTRKIFID